MSNLQRKMIPLATEPIDSLEDLWKWDGREVDKRLIGNKLKHYSNHQDKPKTLICHDMMGGYLPEDCTDGCVIDDSIKPYIVMHWWYIDIFTYFSHRFITIPPVGWINQAHGHGVLILGTFITEWKGGSEICRKALKNVETVNRTVMQLVSIAVVYNFDGWLVNIENKIESEDLPMLHLFLSSLTSEMRNALGERSRVIWYDSVTVFGELKWQNELNELNERWFNITNGIFLNYPWKPAQLRKSQNRAKDRLDEVYVGVDCFGRGSYELSVALFAPGWVAQKFPGSSIVSNSIRFWDRLAGLVHSHRIISLPIKTNFSLGLSVDNSGSMLYKLSEAETQPFYLDSSAFPQSSRASLILPDPGDYKLFQTDVILEGLHKISVDTDTPAQVLFWKDDDNGNEPINFTCTACSQCGKWHIRFSTSLIRGIGLRTERLTIMKGFMFYRLDDQKPSVPNCEVHEFPPIKK